MSIDKKKCYNLATGTIGIYMIYCIASVLQEYMYFFYPKPQNEEPLYQPLHSSQIILLKLKCIHPDPIDTRMVQRVHHQPD